MRLLISTIACLAAACADAPQLTSPTPIGTAIRLRSEVACIPTVPSGLTYGQVQGRTDITWDAVEGVSKYNVWIQNRDTLIDLPGSPATADNNRFEVRLDDAIWGVRVRSVCGDDGWGEWSDAIVIGGRSGPSVPPAPPAPVPPPSCVQSIQPKEKPCEWLKTFIT